MTKHTDRQLALIAGLVLAFFFVICSAFQVVTWTAGAVDKSAQQVIPGPVKNLRIDAKSSDISLVPVPAGADVVIDSEAKGSLHAPKLHTEVSGTDVKVSGGCPDITFGHCSATLVVRVPAGTNVEVDAGSGDIVAEGLNANATLRTGSGDVVARDLGGSEVQLESASGDVFASQIRAPVASAQTASGDVELSFAIEPTNGDAQTHSGDVRIQVPHGAARYLATADSNSGDDTVHVDFDSHSKRILRAETNSGDARVDYSD